MAKAIIIDNQNVVISNEQKISFGNRIIIKSFVKIIGKIARPLLVSITALVVRAAAKTEQDAEDFLHDVLEELDND